MSLIEGDNEGSLFSDADLVRFVLKGKKELDAEQQQVLESERREQQRICSGGLLRNAEKVAENMRQQKEYILDSAGVVDGLVDSYEGDLRRLVTTFNDNPVLLQPDAIAYRAVVQFRKILLRYPMYADMLFAGYEGSFNRTFDQKEPPIHFFSSPYPTYDRYFPAIDSYANRYERVILASPIIKARTGTMPLTYDALEASARGIGAKFPRRSCS